MIDLKDLLALALLPTFLTETKSCTSITPSELQKKQTKHLPIHS